MTLSGVFSSALVVLFTVSAALAVVHRHRRTWYATLRPILLFLGIVPPVLLREIFWRLGDVRAAWYANLVLAFGFFGVPSILLVVYVLRLLSRARIGVLMAVIGFVALGVAAVARPFDPLVMTLLAAAVSGFFVFALLVLVAVVLAVAMAACGRCPGCGRRGNAALWVRWIRPPRVCLRYCRNCGRHQIRRLGRPWFTGGAVLPGPAPEAD